MALILARSENSARLKCHRQTHTTNFLHFTCRAKPCVSLQSAPLLHHGSSSLRGCRRCCRAAAAAAVRLPPCPTQSSCRWQCHCNANIGIETFFSTEATDSLSLYPPKSSGTYRDCGIFPDQMFAGKYFLCQKKNVLNCALHQLYSFFMTAVMALKLLVPTKFNSVPPGLRPPSSSGSVLPTSFFPLDQSKQS